MKYATCVDIEYHADDYGLFPSQSQKILDCCQTGCLNAVSVMPNSPYLAECMEMLRPYQEKVKIAVHLNFMEGHCLCDPKQADRLVNQKGVFNISFGKLLAADFLPGREEYRRQLRREISMQIHAVKKHLPPGIPLRIDSHAHYHMLPSVFDSLIQVIQSEKLNVEYIRFPCEKWQIYMSTWRHLKCLKFINAIKVVVLNFLVARNRRIHKKYLSSLEQRLFLGVALSGMMTAENISTILPKAISVAEARGWGVELLAHPGGVYEPEDIAQLTNKNDILFLTSNLRQQEAEAFIFLKGYKNITGKEAEDESQGL